MKRFVLALAAAALVGCSSPEVSFNRSGADIVNFGHDTLSFYYPVESLAAGSSVDFFATVAAVDSASPAHWAFEYFDGAEWNKTSTDIHVLPNNGGHNTVIAESFTMAKAIKDDEVRVRLVAMDPTGDGSLVLAGDQHVSARICTYQGVPVKQTINVGCIGNSFTYFYGAAFLLKEIARCEGVQIDLSASLKGGQYFRQHSQLELTREMMAKGGYDYVFLQDQSQQSARYYTDGLESVATETKALADQVLACSPSATIVLEATWAYEGSANWQGYSSFEAFDEALEKGAQAIADRYGYECSPIGKAFAAAREKGVNLYFSDNKHQGLAGSYLKACVNYMLITGKPLDGNAPDCGLDPDVAATLRAVAEATIF